MLTSKIYLSLLLVVFTFTASLTCMQRPLIIAVAVGNTEDVKRLLNDSTNLEDFNLSLVEHNNPEMIQLFIKRGWNPFKAMMYAIKHKTASLITILNCLDDVTRLGTLAHVTSEDPQNTLLHYAAQIGCYEAVSILLRYGSSPLTLNKNGQTPEGLAQTYGHIEVAYLIANYDNPLTRIAFSTQLFIRWTLTSLCLESTN